MQITGVILAGGKSRRMGTEKGLVEFMGRPLMEYALEKMQKLADRILISANTNAYDQYDFEVVHDIFPDSGPMGGIYSCLEQSNTENNLLLSCDTPFVTVEFFRYLVHHSAGYTVVAPWHKDEHYEPLCAFYSKSVLPVMERFIQKGNYKIPDLFKEVKFLPLKMHPGLPFYNEYLFYNINSQKELKAAEKWNKL